MHNRSRREDVNERMKLIMDRLIARAISQDPGLILHASQWLRSEKDKGLRTEWWVDEWLSVLSKPTSEVVGFVRSRTEDARRLAASSPFYRPEISGIDFGNLELRRRLWKKAVSGVLHQLAAWRLRYDLCLSSYHG